MRSVKVVSSGIITTVAGSRMVGVLNPVSATAASFFLPESLALSSTGDVYVADSYHTIRKVDWRNLNFFFVELTRILEHCCLLFCLRPIYQVTTSGLVVFVAGTPGQWGYDRDGVAASSAVLRNPVLGAVSSSGDLYLADNDNNRVRKVTCSRWRLAPQSPKQVADC